MVDRSPGEQRQQNEKARPFLEAAVRKKLQIGASLEHAKEVLASAGLDCSVARGPISPPRVQSIYRAGRESGFSIQLELGNDDRISKIDIQEYFTGP